MPGVSSFLFGSADLPQQRGLVARRKAVRWYDGEHGSTFDNIQADIGPPPTARYGLTGTRAFHQSSLTLWSALRSCDNVKSVNYPLKISKVITNLQVCALFPHISLL